MRLVLLLTLLLLTSPASPATAAGGHPVYIASDIYSPFRAEAFDRDKAIALRDQAHQAARDRQTSRALQLATEALRYDPDEPTCRRVLGYEWVEDVWLTPFQEKQRRRGRLWDARFGWIKAADLSHYEAGERPTRQGRRMAWVSVEQEAATHASIRDGWQVRTDHFAVTTNHSREAAVRLGVELEQLFQVWRQLFGAYYLGDTEVLARFEGRRRARNQARPFQVFYHRDKAGYIAALRHKQPQIAKTIGIYFDDTREAHFYDPTRSAGEALDPALARATMYHEAVHQLFQESVRAKNRIGAKDNFWAIEGVACYFESLVPTKEPDIFLIGGDGLTGGDGAGRLANARVRLAEGYLTPFDEMASLGLLPLQRRSDITALYGQAASVATFLMHADEGRYRERFVEYLRRLYAGKSGDRLLADVLEVPLDDVQTNWVRWMRTTQH